MSSGEENSVLEDGGEEECEPNSQPRPNTDPSTASTGALLFIGNQGARKGLKPQVVHNKRPLRPVFRWKEGSGVRSGPGAARTILLFHIISARTSKQPRMVRTFLKVHTRPRLAFPLRCRGYESNKQHHLSLYIMTYIHTYIHVLL
jgi:hypothetical protein